MLNELGAADGGYQELGFLARGAGSVVHRAVELLLQNGPVDLAQFLCRGGVLHADHNAVRMEKISNGGAFAKKFWIGCHTEFYVAVSGVGGQRPAELKPGARWDSALFDYELGCSRFRGNLPRHVINSGKVRLARFFWRSPDANENGFSRANGFPSVRGVADMSCLARGSQNLFKVLFIDGHASSLELGNAVAINVRADDLVPGLCKAGSSDQSDVSTSDNGKTQKASLNWSSTGDAVHARESLSVLWLKQEKEKSGSVLSLAQRTGF